MLKAGTKKFLGVPFFILLFSSLVLSGLSFADDTATETQSTEITPTDEAVPSLESIEAGATATAPPPPTTDPSHMAPTIDSKVGPSAEVIIFTGAATYSIPIEVPPGRLGLAPKLALSYNSYQMNGWVGVGWSLDMGSIQRSTKHGLDYSANDYVFSVNGATTELVARPEWEDQANYDPTTPKYFGAKIEGDFTKFYHPSSNSWVVTTKDGTKHYYGYHSLNGEVLDGKQTNSNGIFKWCLVWVEDTNGNFIRVKYWKDDLLIRFGYVDAGTEIYLDRIEYTGNNKAGIDTSNYVQFTREARTDAPLMNTTNSAVKTYYRLKTIEVAAKDINGNYQLARKYELEYDADLSTPASDYSFSTGQSLLGRITQFGSDGSTLPPTTFEWSNELLSFNPKALLSPPDGGTYYWGGHNDYPPSTQAFHFTGDFNGDGKMDLMYYYDNGWWVLTSNGNSFNPKVRWSPNDGGRYYWDGYDNDFKFQSSQAFHFTGDFNGDGKTDFMYYYDNGWWVLTSNENGNGFNPKVRWSPNDGGRYFWKDYDAYPNMSTQPFHFVDDFNGDGKMDFMYYDDGWWVLTSNGNGFNPKVQWSPNDGGRYFWEGYDGFDGNRSSQLFHFIGDFNGDGKMDFMYYDGGWQVLVSNGNGFNPKVRWSPDDGRKYYWERYEGGHCNQSFHFIGDFNGDGKTDFMYLNDNVRVGGDWWVLLSDGNRFNDKGGWSPPDIDHYYWNDYGDVWGSSQAFHFTGDFNGDGKTDFMYYNGGWWVLTSNGNWFNDKVLWSPNDGGRYYWEKYNDQPRSTQPFQFTGDYNGDGKTDFIYWDGGWQGLGSKEPAMDVIKSISNSFGGSTAIEYTHSSAWPENHLPFIVPTVSSITFNDGFGALSPTNYTYSGGYFDYEDRDFRGFDHVTQTNPDRTYVETWFHQRDYIPNKDEKFCFYEENGIQIRDASAFKGKPCVETLNSSDGTVLSQTVNTWRKTLIQNTSAQWVKRRTKRTDIIENGDSTAFTQEDYIYEAYSPSETIGYPRDVTISGTDADPVTTTTLYENQSASGWVWRPIETSVTGCKYWNLVQNLCQPGMLRKTNFYYYANGKGNLWKQVLWLEDDGADDTSNDPTVTMTYDSYGNKQTEKDARGKTTTTEYDSTTNTYPSKITYPTTTDNPTGGPQEHVVKMEDYDYRCGRPGSETDENGNVAHYFYSPFCSLEQTDYSDGGRTTICRSWEGGCEDDNITTFPRHTITSVKEKTTGPTIDKDEYLDGLGRSIQITTYGETLQEGTLQDIVTTTTYDSMGRVQQVDGPYFPDVSGAPPEAHPIVKTTYDDRGRPDKVKSSIGDNVWATTTYTYSGLSTTISDPDYKKKTETKDYLGRLIEVVEHNGQTLWPTDYFYNAAGDLLSVMDFKENVTDITYDTLGRKTSMSDPDMGGWQYAYDKNGNLLTQTDENGQIISYAYDELNRVMSKSYSGTSVPANNADVTYTYDNPTINSNGIGRLYEVDNTNAQIWYDSYDKMGRIWNVWKKIAGNGATYKTLKRYDLSGKLTNLTYPVDNYYIKYDYHPGSGLLKTAKGYTNDGVFDIDYSSYSNYGPSGKIGQMAQNNGLITTTYTYDDWSLRLTDIKTRKSDATGFIQNQAYTYSNAGDILTIIDKKPTLDVTYTYAYDYVHRLKSEISKKSDDTDAYPPIIYTYNPIGNIMTKVVGIDTLTYVYDPVIQPHAFKEIKVNGSSCNVGMPCNIRYDNNGNMTDGLDFTDLMNPTVRTITYNADNMPVQIIRNGTSTDIMYDGEGQRAKKTANFNPVSVTYYIDNYYERIDGEAVKYVFAGDLRVAKVSSSGKSFYHKDHLGSSMAMTDSIGAAFDYAKYMPFGEQRTGAATSGYKFTDQEFDAETGLYNYDARLYDQVLGRFISADTVVPDYTNPQSLNRYSYCRNNPLIALDPTGHVDEGGADFCSDSEGSFFGGSFVSDSASYLANNPNATCVFDSAAKSLSGWFANSQNSYAEKAVPSSIAGVADMKQLQKTQITDPAQAEAKSGTENVLKFVSTNAANWGVGKLLGGGMVGSIGKWLNSEKLLNNEIQITEKGLQHVTDGHTIAGALNVNKSIFNANVNIVDLINSANKITPNQQMSGNFERIVNAGRAIGVDRTTGMPTSSYTVITDKAGKLVTAFPGFPVR